MLRLPLSVRPVFMDWLARTLPDRREKIENAIRAVRGGALNVSQFGERLTGAGLMADQIKQMFRAFVKKHGLDRPLPELDCSQFRPPTVGGQLRLF